MKPWMVSVSAACITAMATLVAAYVAFAKDRKDQRALIIRDLEIAEKLPDGSKTKELLTTYAETRAALLPLENYVRWLLRRGVLGFAFVMVNGIVAPWIVNPNGPNGGTNWVLYFVLLVGLLAVILIPLSYWAFIIDGPRNKLIDQYLSENHLPKISCPPRTGTSKPIDRDCSHDDVDAQREN